MSSVTFWEADLHIKLNTVLFGSAAAAAVPSVAPHSRLINPPCWVTCSCNKKLSLWILPQFHCVGGKKKRQTPGNQQTFLLPEFGEHWIFSPSARFFTSHPGSVSLYNIPFSLLADYGWEAQPWCCKGECLFSWREKKWINSATYFHISVATTQTMSN